MPRCQRREWISPKDSQISLVSQLELSGLSRTAYYYESVGETDYNLELMTLIDRVYTRYPFYGSRRMAVSLRGLGHIVNRKRVRRLMRKMGLCGVFPGKGLSTPARDHQKYPYLLKALKIDRPDLVWATDITYIRVEDGFLYLTAVLDWYSRFVLSWELSNTLDVTFCLLALKSALKVGKPEIFNTDQGSQYTSKEFQLWKTKKY